MKTHAFTLVELLVSFSILLVLIWLIPPFVADSVQTYQEKIFIQEFENDLKLAQTNAQATGQLSTVKVNTPEQNRYTVSCPGNSDLNAVKIIPDSIRITGQYNFNFVGMTGNINELQKVSKILFRGKYYSYGFTFHLGGGRYYVKVYKN